MVLHPNASDTVLRIVYRIALTPDDPLPVCHARFVDGLKGQGQPVKNVITMGGASRLPTRSQGIAIHLKVIHDEGALFLRADPNGDGRVDLADAVWIVHDIIPALNGPHAACR